MITEEVIISLKREIFFRIIAGVPICSLNEKDKYDINSDLLEKAAKETNKIVDIFNTKD